MMTIRATAIGIAKAISTVSVAGLAMTVMFASFSTTASAQQLDPPIDAQVDANADGAESQKRVEAISSATDNLIAEFRLTSKKIESLQIFNRQLRQVKAKYCGSL